MFKKSIYLLLMGIALTFSSCKKDPAAELESRLKNIGGPTAELGTIEYTISKLIAADHEVFYKIGDRKILFSSTSTMKAGIDISKFTAENVSIDEKANSITVTMPKAKVLAFNLPAENIKLEYEKVSGMRHSFTPEERIKIHELAEQDIIADAENLGILKDAEDNAKLLIEGLLSNFGYKKINVVFQDAIQ